MTQRRPLYLLSFLAVLLTFFSTVFTACEENLLSYEPIASDGAIVFATPALEVESEPMTRAPKEVLASGEKFGVLGYCVPYEIGNSSNLSFVSGTATWANKFKQSVPNVFYKTGITVGASVCSYEDPKKYWYVKGQGLLGPDVNSDKDAPNTADTDNFLYTFFAYYPYNNSNMEVKTSETTKGGPSFVYTMPFNSTNASTALTIASIEDAMIALRMDHKKSDGHVAFHFTHLLSSISFKVANYSEEALTIRSIKVKAEKMYKTVTDDYASGESVIKYDGTYSGTFTLFNGSQTGFGEEAAAVGETLMLIPGNASYRFGNGAKLTVTFNYTMGSTTTEFTTELPVEYTPKSGVNYSYQFNWLGEGQVVMLLPEANDWEDGEADDNNEANDDITFM